MIITKKALPRRAVLRGLGATIALPLLDSMVPALTALAKTPAHPVRRLGIVQVGMGAAPGYWVPDADGTNFELSPILRSLKPFKDRVVVVSGLDNKVAVKYLGEPGGGHAHNNGCYLTAVHPKATLGGDFRAGVSIDQIAANTLGQETELPSLELQLDEVDMGGVCDGLACPYMNTLCWRTPTTPLPMENNPRMVFERLFGDTGSTDPAVRRARRRRDRSILDAVVEQAAGLQRGAGSHDRSKLDQYIEAIRDAEKRIQKAEAEGDRALVSQAQPAGIPTTWDEHAKLMFDLQVLAYQSDMTRVITFSLVRETSVNVYPETGLPDPHHPLSHHMNDPENLAKLSKVNAYHVKLFAYYLQKLQATPDGDGTLLDHVLLMYGSGLGNPNEHNALNLPFLLAGGASGQLKGGRHLRNPKGTPLANVYMSMLSKLGVPVEHFGDATGELQELSNV